MFRSRLPAGLRLGPRAFVSDRMPSPRPEAFVSDRRPSPPGQSQPLSRAIITASARVRAPVLWIAEER